MIEVYHLLGIVSSAMSVVIFFSLMLTADTFNEVVLDAVLVVLAASTAMGFWL